MIATAFILGLLGSFHCVGMCGPIAFLLPLDRQSNCKKLLQLALYHLGRLFTYALLGLLFGLLGKSLYLFGFQQQLSVAVGILMILAVVLPQRILSKFKITTPLYSLIGKVKSSLGAQLKKRTPDTFFAIGFLNGFLPCGLVYMAIFGAVATGELFNGTLYMLAFGFGTIPLMTTAVYLGNFLKGDARQRIRKTIPVFVIIVGSLFILRGMGLGIPYLSPKPLKASIEAQYECHSISFEETKNENEP